MSRDAVQKLIGMACTDPEFRSRLLTGADAAIDEYGLDLTEDEREGVRNLRPADIDEFASAFVARFGSDRAAY